MSLQSPLAHPLACGSFPHQRFFRPLLARLETPFEQGWAITFEGPGLVAGLQLLQDLSIWTEWTEADRQNPGAARTLDELLSWAHTTYEPNLLRRFLRHIAALYVIQETGPLDIPSFGNYHDVFGRDFFSYGVMTSLTQYKMIWTDVYDTQPLVAGADLTKPLFVDVGGAQGLDAQRVLDRHPDLPADILIVQDLPEVVTTHGKEKLDSRIRKMAHDFFQLQPITGVRAYFFHAVPHDWPNADVARMFAEVKKIMTPGYSKLLIYEVVLPAQGAMHLMTTLDLALMSCTSGLERTEEAWRALLKEGGFKVTSISRHPMAVESVIEAGIE
ncbi:S-adenosyl-L-methionine-dependent methyltransferase [Aspergillus novoparasiticus]|uniref:S-adenosyl-L-methionine-dependent methyltransferase n=1 Tax=Aspergillus novoparasiticus TaxID=986946 RepID=A0A5N6EQZ5_9EURO|nr:S-adenosyl-L-methionine-dependent methyltransferase [Aspergillus novoparasiticus]